MSSNPSLDSAPTIVQILYDGTHPPCVQEVNFWQERYRLRSPLNFFEATFVEIKPDELQEAVVTLSGEPIVLKQSLVAVLPTGKVLQDQALFAYLEKNLGLGLLHQASRWPILGSMVRGWHQSWITEHLPCTGQWYGTVPDGMGLQPSTPLEPLQPEKRAEPKAEAVDATIAPEESIDFWDNLLEEVADSDGLQENQVLETEGNVDSVLLNNSLVDTSLVDNVLDNLLAELPENNAVTSWLDFDSEGVDHYSVITSMESVDEAIDLDLLDLELDGWEPAESLIAGVEVIAGVDVLDELLDDNLVSNSGSNLDLNWNLNSDEPLPDLDYLALLLNAEELSCPIDLASDLPSDLPLEQWLLENPSGEIPSGELPSEESAVPIPDGLQSMDTLIESSPGSLGMPIGGALETTRQQPENRSGQNMKVPVRQLDTLSNLIAEMVVSRNCMENEHERLRQFLGNLLYQMQQLSDIGQRFEDLYERSLLESALASNRKAFSHLIPRSPSQRNKRSQDFDALEMDQFTEFHLLSQEMIELIVRARESASDIDYVINEPLDYIARHFRQVTTQVQESINRTRMVPFEQCTTRLPRAIREVASRSGKEARLIVEGKDTLVDKVLLEQLYDPLNHLVNNAVIHGIEAPADRRKLSKDTCGKITIRAFYQGNQTVIMVKDDGAGINADRVRQKALQLGLINLMQAQTLKDIRMFDFIFHPGFSTRDHADNFSGRGVGMDVVKTKIENIRGTISIDSTPGQGTRFTIRLPLTLSITRALSCISNRARLAFPMDSVEDMLDIHQDEVQYDRERGAYIQWRQEEVPLKLLSELLRYNRSLNQTTVYAGKPIEDDMISIIILRTTGEHFAVQVDWVEGEKEIVIKQLERPITKPPGIAGVTVLSDGHILPIVDVLELVEVAQGRFHQPFDIWRRKTPSAPVTQEKHQPLVLIVDDSITVRELLSMTFKKGNYRVEQARDGREAWEKLRAGLPCDLIFCDIEMPRMTGLELLEKLQRDPMLRKIPTAMLTSRGADRHRQMATQLGAKAYFTKPYLEEILLEAAQRMLQEANTERGA